MSNEREKNLKPFTADQSHEEAVKNGKKGGVASGRARREKKTTRQIAEMLDSLAVVGKNKDVLEQLGVPEADRTQQTVRLVALHKKAMSGDVAAIKLWLDITGEAPTPKLDVEVSDSTRCAYDKAAAAIKARNRKKRG